MERKDGGRRRPRFLGRFGGVLGLVAVASAVAVAAETSRDIYKGSAEQRLDALAAVQPGLGTVMREYGSRFTEMYFAAKGGNWRLAQYQLKEMLESQEVGEATRPNRAAALKGFEAEYLVPLRDSLKKKDFPAFEAGFRQAAAGCNGCHAGTGHGFVRYVLPQAPAESYIDVNLKTEPEQSGKDE